MLGYRMRRLRAIVSMSLCRTCACAGNAPNADGCAMACLTHAICTCCGVTPAAVSRESTVVHVAACGSIHFGASCPLCAPLTMMSLGFLLGSPLARGRNALEPEANSSLVLDMP